MHRHLKTKNPDNYKQYLTCISTELDQCLEFWVFPIQDSSYSKNCRSTAFCNNILLLRILFLYILHTARKIIYLLMSLSSWFTVLVLVLVLNLTVLVLVWALTGSYSLTVLRPSLHTILSTNRSIIIMNRSVVL